VGFIVVSLLAVALLQINPFLSPTRPVKADALIVEGWLPDYVLKNAVEEFNHGKYRLLVTTGGPLSKGSFLSEYKTYAELSAATIMRLGLKADQVMAVPAPRTTRDRTYASALAVRQWLSASNSDLHAVNVLSLGPHARRSRLLYQKAFGKEFAIGVISCPDEDYDQKHWWTSSAGVRTMPGEVIAYLYARFLFHP